MNIYKYRPEEVDGVGATVSAGAWSGDTLRIIDALCHQIYVSPTTASTTYTLTITDPNGVEVRKYVTVTGVLNDLTPWLARGVHTIAISSASVDEAFTIMISFRE